jgi:nanoRNase/pAp phosphatase (c-di-AMP/oligoRNAs hydrolase)
MAGILTDTNVFYNTNVTATTHKVASELLEL